MGLISKENKTLLEAICIGEKNKFNNNFIGISPLRLCNRKYNECLKKSLHIEKNGLVIL